MTEVNCNVHSCIYQRAGDQCVADEVQIEDGECITWEPVLSRTFAAKGPVSGHPEDQPESKQLGESALQGQSKATRPDQAAILPCGHHASYARCAEDDIDLEGTGRGHTHYCAKCEEEAEQARKGKGDGYKRASGVVPWREGDEPPEQAIARIRGRGDD